MVSLVFFTLILGVFERVGMPRFLAIPYVVAFVSGFKDINVRVMSAVFVAGIIFDLIWQSRLGVASFMFLLCLSLFDQLKIKFGNQVLWISGLVSIVVTVIYFMISDWPIVWWQLIVVYLLTLIFNKMMSGDRGSRGEVFLRRS